MQNPRTNQNTRSPVSSSAWRLIVLLAAVSAAKGTPPPMQELGAQVMASPPPEERPGPEVSAYERALELYRRGRFEQAALILEHHLERGAVADDKEKAGSHALLGWCRYRMGEVEDALSSFRESLRLSPESADALEGVARAAARLRKNVEAIDAVVALARLHPEVDVDDVANLVLDRAVSQPGLSDRRLSRGRRVGPTPTRVSRARGSYLEVRRNGSFEPIFVKGVNLGAALPGRYPAEFPRDKALYATWLGQMAEMGANAVRLYTLLPPEFYQALHEHNGRAAGSQEKDGFLWLLQGVWTELPEDDDYDAPEFRREFLEEIERVIDAVHGNVAVAHRRGHAFGLYDVDVSDMTLGYILGREWEPYSVAAYDTSRPHPATHHGEYFEIESGTPMEAWFASVLDHAVGHETRTYNAQKPIAFTNWPTLDPVVHPTEATKKEEVELLKALGLPQEPGTLLEYDNDAVSIDTNRIRPTASALAGIFAAYHAYPYYPDFMNVDPGYLRSRDRTGPSNYVGYLRQLKAHHRDIPLLIAEVGVPTSRGIAHLQPQGWHHGGHTEKEQGEIDARLMEDINETGCAGGVLFAWLDEWFKKNWLVIAFEVPWENNKNWLNILDPEQNYGLLACKPGRDGWRITIDGRSDDWRSIPPLATSAGPLRSFSVTHDEAYIYVKLDVDRIDWKRNHYVIGIDTYGAREGDHRMPLGLDLTTPTGMEFVVDLTGRTSSRVLCDTPYDLHTNRFNRPWKSSENRDGLFTEMLAETNRRRVSRDGVVYPTQTYNRSPLRYGTMDPKSADYDDLVEWSAGEAQGFIELRLGWNLLNVTDPSTRQVLDDPIPPKGGAGHTTTDGFRFYVAAREPGGKVVATLPAVDAAGRFDSATAPFYTWDTWDEPSWHSYPKKSYFILKDRLAPLQALRPAQAAPPMAPAGASCPVAGPGDGR